MSKSSFHLLLLTVAILTATASIQSGGRRMGSGPSFRYEANADMGSLKDDMRGIHEQALRTPKQLHNLLDDTAKGLHSLSADVRVDARLAARRLATFIKIW